MGNRVARVKTDVSEAQMAQGIIDAWRQLFNHIPTKQQISLVLAQNHFETGGRAAMWNFNVGNITTDGKDDNNYFDDLTTNEQDAPGVWKKHNLKYRAYGTLKDGCVDYLKFLSQSSRYKAAWNHIKHPDPVAFSKSLKDAGYYTGDEKSYTARVSSLFSKYNKSNGYEQALSGKVKRPSAIGKTNPFNVATTEQAPSQQPVAVNTQLNSVLDRFIQMISSADISLKKLYKTALPNHNIIIEIKAGDYTTAVEFSRILCTALDEDLLSSSYPHTDGDLVEIECSIAGPEKECFQAVQQMSQAVAETFKDATIKLGGLKIKTNCIMNKKSFYQPISHKTAETNYRKFLLKFI